MKNIFIFILLVVLCSVSESVAQDKNTIKDFVITNFELKAGEGVDKDVIKNSIQTQFPSIKPWVKRPKFDKNVLEDDLNEIKGLYEDHGYYDAKVTTEVEEGSKSNEVKVAIEIDQGDPVILQSLNIIIKDGLPQESDQSLYMKEEITKRVPLRPGEIFSKIKLQASKKEINKILLEEGYPKFTLNSQALVSKQKKWAEANLEIDTGPKYRFGKIDISGNQKVADHLIIREILYAQGEDYSFTKIIDTRSALFHLGYFSSVNIEQTYNELELTVSTLIIVKEKKFGSIMLGIGFATEDSLRGQLELRRENFMGGGRDLDVLVRASFITQIVQLSIDQPHIIGKNSELTGSLSFERDDLPSYKGYFTTSSLSLKKRFNDILLTRGGVGVIYSNINSQSVNIPLEQSRENVLLTTLTGEMKFSRVDDILNPTQGVASDLKLETSAKELGSEANYVLALIDMRAYKRLSKFVFSNRLKIGALYSFGSTQDQEIPVFRRFFAGGSNSVRGYEFQKLGPLNDDGDPIGGNSLIIGSSEIRFALPIKHLEGAMFLDYGNVRSGSFDYPLDDLKYAIGTGLRYETLIGPLRFDIGYALNPDDKIDRFHVLFGVGQAF